MLELPDVTLFSIYNNLHELNVKALEECLARVKFGAVRIFTDKVVGPEAPHATVMSFRDVLHFEHFANYEMPKCIQTSHVLTVQWDSWIVHPSEWTDEFLQYDYIGAPWGFHKEGYKVGNGGFSLRSRALLDYLVEHPVEFPMKPPEDALLCRFYQKDLPQFKWAPEVLAYHFSFEDSKPPHNSFGFHGLYNFPYALTNEQIEQRLANAPRNVLDRWQYPQMRQRMRGRR